MFKVTRFKGSLGHVYQGGPKQTFNYNSNTTIWKQNLNEKQKKYHVGEVSILDKNIQTEAKSIPLSTHIRDRSLTWFGAVTSIKRGGVKPVSNKFNHNINKTKPGSVENMTTANNMIDIKSSILLLVVSDEFLK